tara:strand:- start:1047 stop:2435 length:1389 start_codon:yes stop_codon:yes gene_type:complete
MTQQLAKLASCLLLATTAASQTWTQLTPTTIPTTRRTGAMEFSLLNGGMLMYGGLQSGPTANLNETWLHNGIDWTQLAPATTPPARWGHRMIYDSRRARIVTFGGRSPGTTTTASDTWEWDGTDWLQMTPTNSPGARAFYSMAYDERRGVTVLYGTQSGSTFSGGDETWEYDGTTWTQIVTPTTPPGLETPAMTYDKGRGVVVMFGGWNGSAPGTMYNTTWEYDGNDWTLRAPTTSPSGRYRAGCCYDDTRSRVLLYGGFGSATALQDTWEWDGNEWTQIAATGPARSTETYMAHDLIQGGTMLFGGSGPTGISDETWLFTAPTTALAGTYGTACAGSTGTPELTPATLPVLGSNYDLGISVGSLTTFVVIAHGLDNLEFVPGVYFPVDLAIAGIAGCDLQVRPDVTVTQLTTAGVALATIPIPNNPALTGQELFSQFFALDVAAPNGFGSMSNAVHAVLGQ